MRLILFDIDGTLVPGQSSERRFARYLMRNRLIGPQGLAAYAAFFACWAPRYGRQVTQLNKAYIQGRTLATIKQHAEDFVSSELYPCLFEPAIERLREHQCAGDTVALLSGTPQFIADALAGALEVDYAQGALLARRGNRPHVLRPPVRHPHGPSKIDAAHELAASTGLPLANALAYGDSPHDRYLFHVVERAIVVGADQRLGDLAAERKWENLSRTG